MDTASRRRATISHALRGVLRVAELAFGCALNGHTCAVSGASGGSVGAIEEVLRVIAITKHRAVVVIGLALRLAVLPFAHHRGGAGREFVRAGVHAGTLGGIARSCTRLQLCGAVSCARLVRIAGENHICRVAVGRELNSEEDGEYNEHHG